MENRDRVPSSILWKAVLPGLGGLTWFIASSAAFPFSLKFSLFALACLLSGGDVLLDAVRKTLKGDFFNENLLISAAVLGAFFIGKTPEAAAVMFLYKAGNLLAGIVIEYCRKSIQSSLNFPSSLGNFTAKNGRVAKSIDPPAVSEILEPVQNTASEKAPTENFMIKFAGVYTSSVAAAALVFAFIPPLVTPGEDFSIWVYRALIFLTASRPCALLASLPLGFGCGIGTASRRGILIKGSKTLEALNEINTVVFDQGTLSVSGKARENAARTVSELRELGEIRVAMLTGDSEQSAKITASGLRIDEYYAGLLPHQKVEKLEVLRENTYKCKLVFVGDGTDDVPALAMADVGVVLGGPASRAANEAADIVFMAAEPYMLVEAVRIAKKVCKTVWQNIVLVLGIKLLVIAFGAAGTVTIWEAVLADAGITVITVFNTLKILKKN